MTESERSTARDLAARAPQARRPRLRIVDLRVAVVTGAPMTCPLLRIDTDQGVYGLGEIRDGASPTYALMLKSRLLGEDPLDVDRLFRKIKQFGGHARQGGGVSGIEMALWDIAGKVYGCPVYQLLGGRFRDRVRCYADTPTSSDVAVTSERLRRRLELGYTFLKIDVGVDLLQGTPGLVIAPAEVGLGQGGLTPHMFTGIELSDAGVARLVEYVAAVREGIGADVPLAVDHLGHLGAKSAIRLGRALEPLGLAWLEDVVPWQATELWRRVTDAVAVPTCAGEDIYLKEGFLELCRHHAVDILHPDLATTGGLLETKKIGDAAAEYGLGLALHFAGTPVSCLANVHCAAACEHVLALEQHSTEVPWWDDLVVGPAKPLVRDGYIAVPDAPGLGVSLNEEVVREHLVGEYFAPTNEWDQERSWDRLWS